MTLGTDEAVLNYNLERNVIDLYRTFVPDSARGKRVAEN